MNELWQMWNSPFGITVVAFIGLYILNAIYTRKPSWKKYQGSIIAAVRYAEKAIDDKTDNKSMARLDAALKYIIAVINEAECRKVSDWEKTELKEGIQIIHNEIEKNG